MSQRRPTEDTSAASSVSPIMSGLKCRCPRCGTGQLFAGVMNLDLVASCSRCGLDYTFIDTGDGPAVFTIVILGLLMLGGALALEFGLHPPIWVHAIIWVPLTLFLGSGLIIKGSHYRPEAENRQVEMAQDMPGIFKPAQRRMFFASGRPSKVRCQRTLQLCLRNRVHSISWGASDLARSMRCDRLNIGRCPALTRLLSGQIRTRIGPFNNEAGP